MMLLCRGHCNCLRVIHASARNLLPVLCKQVLQSHWSVKLNISVIVLRFVDVCLES